ncbi:type II secretion system protein J [Chryseomicrobium palamuruense]|uniref:Type II secretion system protein J n=1 Tax=Chryseomicrobium palamuruense TaxID=682973 RepID=A0ABV8UXF9_9BACL
MNSSIHNQKGITLVEILAAIVIVSFLTVIIWRFFFQTIDYNTYAVTEQTLQQEANVILAKLQAEHTKNTIHALTIENGALTIYKGGSCSKETISKRNGITYSLVDSAPHQLISPCNRTLNGLISNSIGNNRINMEVKIDLSSAFKDIETINYTLSTRLSKLTAN